MSRKTGRIVGLAACVCAVAAMSVTAVSASAEGLKVTGTQTEWPITGSLEIHKLKETIALPAGSYFTGKAELEIEVGGISGTETGHTYVPPFTAPLSILGIPTVVGLTFTEVGSVNGSVTSTYPENCTPANPTCVTLAVPFEANMGITSVSIDGFKIPTQCETKEPVKFPLSTNLTVAEIIAVGSHFAGTTTLPNIKCGGLFGGLLGPVLSLLMSGPENAYVFNIRPPA
jgi:hypothetical protein